nr:uncharacterized protein LOC109404080 [Aedes albopictus]XP_029723766.1 uncharacterized protein LOC109404080 [Aedes albopictus]
MEDYSQVQTEFEMPHPELAGVSVLYKRNPVEIIGDEKHAIDPSKDVSFVLQGNRRKLYVKDHCYYRKHTLKNHTQWRCTEYRAYGCLASVKVSRNGLQMTLQGVHDHPVKKEHRREGQLRELMEKRKQTVNERKQQRRKAAEVVFRFEWPRKSPTVDRWIRVHARAGQEQRHRLGLFAIKSFAL